MHIGSFDVLLSCLSCSFSKVNGKLSWKSVVLFKALTQNVHSATSCNNMYPLAGLPFQFCIYLYSCAGLTLMNVSWFILNWWLSKMLTLCSPECVTGNSCLKNCLCICLFHLQLSCTWVDFSFATTAAAVYMSSVTVIFVIGDTTRTQSLSLLFA